MITLLSTLIRALTRRIRPCFYAPQSHLRETLLALASTLTHFQGCDGDTPRIRINPTTAPKPGPSFMYSIPLVRLILEMICMSYSRGWGISSSHETPISRKILSLGCFSFCYSPLSHEHWSNLFSSFFVKLPPNLPLQSQPQSVSDFSSPKIKRPVKHTSAPPKLIRNPSHHHNYHQPTTNEQY